MSLAASYLELLQKNHLSLLGTHGAFDADSPVYDWVAADFAKQDRQLAGRLRGVLKQRLAKAAADRPSQYQDPSTYSILTSLATHVEEAATAAGIDLPRRPVFGTLPLGQFNAMAIRVPRTDEHIIVFQEGVFGFLNLLSKAVSTCFPETDGGEGSISFSVHPADIDAHLDRNPEPIERFQQFLDAYVLKGHPDLAAPYILTGTHQAMAAMMLESAELFVMGHEYAHVIQGHLNQEHMPHEGLGGDIEAASHSLVQELEADILGLKLSVESMVRKHRVDASLAFFGVHLVFSAIELVDRAIEMLVPGFAPSSAVHETHPPPDMRREYLNIYLAQGVGDEAGAAARRLGEQVHYALDALWERCEDHYEFLSSVGAEPSPIWLR